MVSDDWTDNLVFTCYWFNVKTDRKWKFQFRPKPKVMPKAGYDFGRNRNYIERDRPLSAEIRNRNRKCMRLLIHYTTAVHAADANRHLDSCCSSAVPPWY